MKINLPSLDLACGKTSNFMTGRKMLLYLWHFSKISICPCRGNGPLHLSRSNMYQQHTDKQTSVKIFAGIWLFWKCFGRRVWKINATSIWPLRFLSSKTHWNVNSSMERKYVKNNSGETDTPLSGSHFTTTNKKPWKKIVQIINLMSL